MRHPLRWVAPLLLALVLPAAATAAADKAEPEGEAKAEAKAEADVKITNRTEWKIHHFYLSSADDETWGPDQLAGQVIASGESFTLQAVPCDQYDVMLVDEDADKCVLGGVDICGQSQAWVIESGDLLRCEGATAAAAE